MFRWLSSAKILSWLAKQQNLGAPLLSAPESRSKWKNQYDFTLSPHEFIFFPMQRWMGMEVGKKRDVGKRGFQLQSFHQSRSTPLRQFLKTFIHFNLLVYHDDEALECILHFVALILSQKKAPQRRPEFSPGTALIYFEF